MDTTTDWQSNCEDHSKRLGYMFKSGLWTDCKFLVGQEPDQEVIEAHRNILAAASPVFAAMFYGEMAERQSPIPIVDIQPETFRAMLTNIYAETVPISSFDEACSVYCAADKYSVLALKEKCVTHLILLLKIPSNICKIYEFASLYEDKRLIDECVKAMKANTNELLNDSSLLEASLGTVVTIFSLDVTNIYEGNMFSALERYVKAQEQRTDQGSEEKSLARVLLEKIRFLVFSPVQFAEGPAKSDLLTESEKFAILMNLTTKYSHVSMPIGFSTCTKPRKVLVKYQ